MATDSPELSRIAAEALDIAKSAGQSPTTTHLLLATFTVPSAADVLLRTCEGLSAASPPGRLPEVRREEADRVAE